MTEDFNIRDNDWDLYYPYHLTSSDILLEIADFFNLKLSFPVNQVLTQYTDNPNNANLVINLSY